MIRYRVAGDTVLTNFCYRNVFLTILTASSLQPWVRQMLMKSLKTNAGQRKHRESGFSLLEMLTSVAIGMTLVAITFISMVPVMKQQRVTNAYNMTLAAMRQARDNAVAQQTSYKVTFATSATASTITVAPTATFQGDLPSAVYQLPTDISFSADTAIAATPTPDSYGTAANSIDFGYTANGVGTGGQASFYFCPDGSAQDAEGTAGKCTGSWDGGVVYIERKGEILSSRAVSLWGGTGRIHGWRLYPNGGGYQWLRQ